MVRASCAGCGATYKVTSARVRACPSCGGEVRVSEEAPTPAFDIDAMPICRICSAMNAPGATRCAECGTALAGDRQVAGKGAAAKVGARPVGVARPRERAASGDGASRRTSAREAKAAGLGRAKIVLRIAQFMFGTGAVYAFIGLGVVMFSVALLGPSLEILVTVVVAMLLVGAYMAALLGVAHRPLLWGGLLFGLHVLHVAQRVHAEAGAAEVIPLAIWTGLVGLGMVAMFDLQQTRRTRPDLYLVHIVGDRRPLGPGEVAGDRLDESRRQSSRVVLRAVLTLCALVAGFLTLSWTIFSPRLNDRNGAEASFLAARPDARFGKLTAAAGPTPDRVVELADSFRDAWQASDLDALIRHVHRGRRDFQRRHFERVSPRVGLTAPWPPAGAWTHERTGESSVTSSLEVGEGLVEVTWIELDGLWGVQGFVPRW